MATTPDTLNTAFQAMPPVHNALPQSLRLLSYNVQAGIPTDNYYGYITGGWRHFIADNSKHENLAQIAHFLKDFDLVALQEVDAGSLRSGYVNQIDYLAKAAGFSHWHCQTNRNLGHFGQHSNGMLCRLPPVAVDNHRLPGRIPGRGAIVSYFGDPDNPLVIVMLHLALTKGTRIRQLQYIADLIDDYEHVIVMGDMNCSAEQLMSETPLAQTDLIPVSNSVPTFPSWRPTRDLDHILVTPSVHVTKVEAIEHATFSDHLPLAIDIDLHQTCTLVA